MPSRPAITIVGAGLAGACAAFALAAAHRVTLLGDGRPGASHAAAGLINPFLGRKARPAWLHREAVGALHRLQEEADLGDSIHWAGLLRPARDEKQAGLFQERAREHPEALTWWEAEAVVERHPPVFAPHGALWVHQGGFADLPLLIERLVAAAVARGATSRITRAAPDDLVAPTLLCTGAGLSDLDLPLHPVKGQTVRLVPARPLSLPPLSGSTYLVPQADGTVLVGATFEHAFETLDPTPEATAGLLARAVSAVPALEGATVVEERAGLRMTVPEAVRPGRHPILGPLPGRPGVWVFGGLGAKGLLTAPLLAEHLPRWWTAPSAIWPEVATGSLLG